jgi:DNA-binding NarL/FixJ family response regulator
VLIVPRVADTFWLSDPGAAPPQALIVDRQPLFLAAIASLLSTPPLNAGVRVATRTDTALEAMSQHPADLVLCEIRAVPLSGAELAAALSERSPSTRVVLLAEEEDDEMLLAAIRSGATGFFTKACPPEEFLEGVRAVLAGHLVVDRSLAQHALGAVFTHDWPSIYRPPSSLSSSERGILAMVTHAQSIASIAAARGITRKTVRNHLSNIYRKLGVRNRTEAILCAARMGLVDADSAARE